MSSIFLDEKVLNEAATRFNQIVISNSDRLIEAVLQEPLQFSVEADWDNIFSVSERFQSAKTLLGTAGLGLFNAGMWTKKFYKGGSYLKINPKIRVVDWDGNGYVLKAAETLIDMCLPIWNGKLDLQTKKILETAISEAKKLGSVDGAVNGVVSIFKGIGNEIANVFNGEDAKRLANLLTGNEILSNSPTPIHVKFSNFYENDFIIESVQVEFSKEMTELGPLYVDISLSLSTPIVSVRGSSGIRPVVNGPRFISV